MILTDGVHLVATEPGELHPFAGGIGLRRRWAQRSRSGIEHYDLTTRRKLRAAVRAGAILVAPRAIVDCADRTPPRPRPRALRDPR